MEILTGLFKIRDKSTNRTNGSSYRFFMGGSSEAVQNIPLHVYLRTHTRTEKAIYHPLYKVLHDEPNPEMTSFVFRETMITHLLLWGNAYAQIIRNGKFEVLGLFPFMTVGKCMNLSKLLKGM